MKIPNKAVIRFEYNDEVKEYFFDMKELNDNIKEKQQRIDKAIEYIEHKAKIKEYFMVNGKEYNELLDILKGSDKDV